MKYTKKIVLFISLISLTYLFTSCSASVSLTSWKDPNYKGPGFSKILVMAVYKDLAFRKAYETQVANSLKEAGVQAVTSMSVLSPDTKYTNKELDDIFTQNSVDGLLTLKYTGTTVTKILHPGYTYYQYYYNAYEVIRQPGYIEKHRSVNVECSLFSTSGGKAVWIAQTKTSNYTSLNDLASSLASEITDNLKADGVIK